MKKFLWAVLVSAIMAVPALSHAANLITNGSFEQGFSNYAGPLWAPSNFTGWTITSGSIDVSYTPSGHWWQAADGLFSLDMNGSALGTIQSNVFTTVPGQTYQVAFAMAGNPAGQYNKTMTLDVSVNGGAPITFSHLVTEPVYYAGMPLSWEEKSFMFVADATSTSLTFASTYSDSIYQGATLDNVRVSAVPLPAALLLFAPGFLGILGLRKKSGRRTDT